jgi:hypothetical protein
MLLAGLMLIHLDNDVKTQCNFLPPNTDDDKKEWRHGGQQRAISSAAALRPSNHANHAYRA